MHNKNHVQLWAKLKLEQQEHAKFGACMALLSETIAQGYSQDHFKKDQIWEGGGGWGRGGGGGISSLLNPIELQLVNQIHEAKNLRSLVKAWIESLKIEVRLHPYKRFQSLQVDSIIVSFLFFFRLAILLHLFIIFPLEECDLQYLEFVSVTQHND